MECEPSDCSLGKRRQTKLRPWKSETGGCSSCPSPSEIPPRPPQAMHCLCQERGSVGSKAAGIKVLPMLRSDAREAARKVGEVFGPKRKPNVVPKSPAPKGKFVTTVFAELRRQINVFPTRSVKIRKYVVTWGTGRGTSVTSGDVWLTLTV